MKRTTERSSFLGYTIPEILIVCAVAGLVVIGIYRLLSFGTSAYTSGEAKLNNLQDATILLMRLKNDVHNLKNTPDGSNPIVSESDGAQIFPIHKVDPATGNVITVKVAYSVVGDGRERKVVRKVLEGPDEGKVNDYGKGSFEAFTVEPVDIDGVKGYRMKVSFKLLEKGASGADAGAAQDAAQGAAQGAGQGARGAVAFDTLIFPRNTGTEIKGDNWEYFSL